MAATLPPLALPREAVQIDPVTGLPYQPGQGSLAPGMAPPVATPAPVAVPLPPTVASPNATPAPPPAVAPAPPPPPAATLAPPPRLTTPEPTPMPEVRPQPAPYIPMPSVPEVQTPNAGYGPEASLAPPPRIALPTPTDLTRSTLRSAPAPVLAAQPQQQPIAVRVPIPSSAPTPASAPASEQGAHLPFAGNFPVTTTYGEKSNIWTMGYHPGVDYGTPMNTPALSVGNGVVDKTGRDADYGNYVWIKYPWGTAIYGHLNRADVREGQAVQLGQEVGLTGNTGKSTGPHLHFETRVNGQIVDPSTVGPMAQAQVQAAGTRSRAPPPQNL